MIVKKIEPEKWNRYAQEVYYNESVKTDINKTVQVKGLNTTRMVDGSLYSPLENITIDDYIKNINQFIYEQQHTFTYAEDINDMRKQIFDCVKDNFLFVDYIKLSCMVNSYRFFSIDINFDYFVPEINFNTCIEIKLRFEIESNSIRRSHKNKTFKIGTQAIKLLHNTVFPTIRWRGISTSVISRENKIFFKKEENASYQEITLSLDKHTFAYFRKEIVDEINDRLVILIPNPMAVIKWISPEKYLERLHMIDRSLDEEATFEDIYKKIIENNLYLCEEE